MGLGQSKEEALYQAVQNSDHQTVKALWRDGASLEWVDKEGRTPLILACTRGDLYDMVITLLDVGARLDAYRAGPHGGYPLHHAAKRGLDKTVILLLSRGANPFAFNEEGLTPLDMARNKSHVSVVRVIEERICLFSGMMRELSGPGFLEVIAPHFVTKKVWVVVLPAQSDPRNASRNELAIYQNSRVAVPRTVISLGKSEVGREEPKFNQRDATVTITATDKSAKVRFKFLSENEGDKAQLEKFYKACAGFRLNDGEPPAASPGPPPQMPGSTMPPNAHPAANQPNPATLMSRVPGTSTGKAKPSDSAAPSAPSGVPIPDEIALEMAMKASLLSASAEGIPVSPSAHQSSSDWDESNNNWPPGTEKHGNRSDYGGWGEGEQNSYGGWDAGSSAGAGPGPSRLGPSVVDNPSTSDSKSEAAKPVAAPTSGLTSSSNSVTLIAPSSTPPAPSAPPLPLDGPIQYPSVDTSPVQLDYASEAGEQKAKEKAAGGQCVICWDAPAEAVCIPCGHLAGCMDCLTEIKSKGWGCPVCRAPIQQVVKVFAV